MFASPYLKGGYTRVYCPGPDVFPGPDSPSFRVGESCRDWVPNDHTVLKGRDGRWHAFGITHPQPPPGANVHEAEWLSFHAASPVGNLKDHLREGAWEDLPKILPPEERPGEIRENHAPFIVERDGVYHMFYGPNPIRLAVSEDLFHWEPRGAVFSQDGGARDPNILAHEGRYIMCYCSRQSVLARVSNDLLHWGDPVEIFRMRVQGYPESPFLVERAGLFYLFWCLWDYDGSEPYNDNTFVFGSEDPLDFNESPQVGHIRAHAPEVFRDESGGWFISSAERPRRGVSIASLRWGSRCSIGFQG